jgi:NADH-quinone oxidoreductase subunit A
MGFFILLWDRRPPPEPETPSGRGGEARPAHRASGKAGAAACYIQVMPAGYIPILIFLVIAILFPIVLIMAAKLIRPSAPSAIKQEAYECGIEAASDSRGRYTVRYYIVAILFVIFDVETIFLFPWAVRYKMLGWFGVAEVAEISAHILMLTDRMVTKLRDKGYRVISSRRPGEASGIVAFISDVHDPQQIQRHLEAEHRVVIAVREGRLRASPHVYNTPEEIDQLVDHLLQDLNARLGITMVIVTHNEQLAETLPRRLRLSAGRLV